VKKIETVAEVNKEHCNFCGRCVKLCPVEAIGIINDGPNKTLKTDKDLCRSCTICVTRCPQGARSLVQRDKPLILDLEIKGDFKEETISELCNKAHMYPNQIICYCYRTTARQVAKAILSGARTPEDIARLTGARTGCGVLCIGSIIRLLRAAGLELGKAPGSQWYGKVAAIWDIPESVIKKYGREYYLEEDRKSMDYLYPSAGGKTNG
jgi:ferredoxin